MLTDVCLTFVGLWTLLISRSISISAYLSTYLLTYPRTYLSTYLPTYPFFPSLRNHCRTHLHDLRVNDLCSNDRRTRREWSIKSRNRFNDSRWYTAFVSNGSCFRFYRRRELRPRRRRQRLLRYVKKSSSNYKRNICKYTHVSTILTHLRPIDNRFYVNSMPSREGNAVI